MSRTYRFLVVLTGLLAGCAPRYRYVDEAAPEWQAERASYPRVSPWSPRKFPPGNPDHVAVYYKATRSAKQPREDTMGPETKPPAGLQTLADLAVFRGPLPDHEGALVELRRMAADLGADTLTRVRYTVVIGQSYLGGSALVGWIYMARASRQQKEETP